MAAMIASANAMCKATANRPSAVYAQPRIQGSMRPVVARFSGARKALTVASAVKFDYDTKVFKKELMKFADTEEYIYRCVRGVLSMRHAARGCAGIRPNAPDALLL